MPSFYGAQAAIRASFRCGSNLTAMKDLNGFNGKCKRMHLKNQKTPQVVVN